jgi:hypothetical protein
MAAGYKTGGRQKGSRNKKTRAREAVLKLATAGIQDADPLEFLLRVMADTQLPLALRLDAAVAAAPFCHPKLRAVVHVDEGRGKSALEELLAEIDGRARGIPNPH